MDGSAAVAAPPLLFLKEIPITYAQTILATANAAGYWRLDDLTGTVAADLVGTNPGLYVGGYTLGQAGPNAVNLPLATAFNGSTGECSTPLTPLTQNHDVTIESWFRCDLVTQTQQEVFAYGDGTSAGFGIVISGNGTTNGNLGIIWHSIAWSLSTTLVTNGVWHHALASVAASGTLALYLDGVLTSAAGHTYNAPIAAHGLAFGSEQHSTTTGGNGFQFKGALASAAIYGRALSQAEALAHYRAGITAPVGPTTTQARPRFLPRRRSRAR
jgi:hypothetical protein